MKQREEGATGEGEDEDVGRDESTIKILIASDSHIGYAERDPVRGDDSHRSFQEVMEIAKEQDVTSSLATSKKASC